MQPIPDDILMPFDTLLVQKSVPTALHDEYRMWLRYYLDFSAKYQLPNERSEQVRLFIEKIRSKGRSGKDLNHAAHALSLFFSLGARHKLTLGRSDPARGDHAAVTTARVEENNNPPAPVAASAKEAVSGAAPGRFGKRYNEWWSLEKTISPDWDEIIINKLSGEIKARHYSRKTLKAYADWSRKFQIYLKHKSPRELSPDDVKSYLTYLAVNAKVSASTQNQAFNALLFLFRHILKKDFGDHKDIPRAKRSSYIPVVLTRQEVDAVLGHLAPPYDLIVKLLYGCGLRLFECLKLRVQNFNFEGNVLTVMDGKGKKARTVPLPQVIKMELLSQRERVRLLHEEDLGVGYAGVLLEDALDRKYRNAAKDFIWQWFFPQRNLTPVPERSELRRYHLSDKEVQAPLFRAVRKARIAKRVTSHTFRHSYATHLLQANYDIRTIQTLLGHSDVRTTMIYTHCVPSRTLTELKSPLDF
jgi:integron integrase